MKKSLVLLMTFYFGVLSHCQNNFEIKAEIKGLENNTSVFMMVPNAKGRMDTLKVISQGNTFTFHGIVWNNPDFAYLQIGEVPDYEFLNESLVLFLDPSSITVKGDISNWPNVIVKGSKANDDYRDYRSAFDNYILPIERYKDCGQKSSSYAARLGAYKILAEYDKYKDSLRNTKDYFFWTQVRKYNRLALDLLKSSKMMTSKQIDSLKMNFILTHPNSLLSPYLLLIPTKRAREQQYVMFNPSHYYIPNLITDVYQLYMFTDTSSLIKDVFKKLSENAKQSYYGQFLKKRLDSLYSARTTVQPGDKFPSFSATSPDGKQVSINQFMGKRKLLLVDFWSSGCAPCRIDITKRIVPLYDKYHNKGFEVVSYSMDTDRSKWIKAIEKDKSYWYHCSDLLGKNSPIAKKFVGIGTSGLPQTFLLDANGIIIARDLKHEALSSKIEEIMRKIN